MANREILHSLFASFCGGFDIFEQNLFINATHLYLFIILLSLPFIIFMVSHGETALPVPIRPQLPTPVSLGGVINIKQAIASPRVTSLHGTEHFLFQPSPQSLFISFELSEPAREATALSWSAPVLRREAHNCSNYTHHSLIFSSLWIFDCKQQQNAKDKKQAAWKARWLAARAHFLYCTTLNSLSFAVLPNDHRNMDRILRYHLRAGDGVEAHQHVIAQDVR